MKRKKTAFGGEIENVCGKNRKKPQQTASTGHRKGAA
jgi:hypothetical protein